MKKDGKRLEQRRPSANDALFGGARGGQHLAKRPAFGHSILFRMCGVLFLLTMFSTWLVTGLYAKYTFTGSATDSAQVASAGTVNLELWEHKADWNAATGVYTLDANTKVTSNSYKKVMPGVDIDKDPFIQLEIRNAEVSYALYVKVTENDFPTYMAGTESKKAVTYELTDKWECVDSDNGIYKYKDVFKAGTTYDDVIQILKNDMLYVSEHYVGNNQEFSLTFSAWVVQVD